MSDQQIGDKKFRSSVHRLSSALDELAESWLNEGIELPHELNQRKYQQVRLLFDQHSKDVIAYSVAALLAQSSMKGVIAQIAATLNFDEIKNRSRHHGMSEKKEKKRKAVLMIKWWDELSAKGLRKQPAAKEICKRFNEEGIKSNFTTVRRDLTKSRLDALRKLYMENSL